MLYREFGKDGWKVSALGFGAMRLPVCNDGKEVDVDAAVKIIRQAIEMGINYIDTAYFYHNGTSEGIVAKALEDGYRGKVRVATKSPVHLIEKPDDFDRILNEQLTHLNTDSIDYYLFHGIGAATYKKIVDLSLINRMEHARKDGRIVHIGFSFHDDFSAFRQIIDGYEWDICQIQYNYMDISNQAGKKGLHYADAKGIPVVIMEPLLGGRLARPVKEVAELFAGAGVVSPAAWSLITGNQAIPGHSMGDITSYTLLNRVQSGSSSFFLHSSAGTAGPQVEMIRL